MPREVIETPDAPRSPLYSQGVRAGSLIYISGTTGADPRDFAGMNEEYAQWFGAAPPTRWAAKLGAEIPGLLVSIRMTAAVAR